jgi:3-deoxy-D-manno-octulosonic-acid transferase
VPFETTGAGAIWFHAVSVGEVLSAATLIRRLREQGPRVPLYVSTTTLAGRTAAVDKLAGIADGVFFAPFDYRGCVRRVLRRLRPALVVVLETEIWPNLYRETKRAGASLLVVNGRISDRALPRYQRWSGLFRHVLCWPDAILVQSEEDRRRFILAGANPDRVRTAGNLKYDFEPPAAGIAPGIARLLARVNPGHIWIAASTMPPLDAGDVDEDDAVIAAFEFLRRRHSGLLLIVVPRKPERFDIVAEKLKNARIRAVRRTRLGQDLAMDSPGDLPGVLLLDSIGELAALFERADAVFMGGTLARRGGHNILEPAYFGKAIVAGPHMENFAAMAAAFDHAGAIERIAQADSLGPAIAQLLEDAARREALGRKARELAMSGRGAVERMAADIWQAEAEGVPDPVPTLFRRIALTPLTWLWRAGHQWNQRWNRRWNMPRGLAAGRALQTPVVSVGGLSIGGAGKTPMVAHLAQRLRQTGHNPAILTRGYKRESRQTIVVPRGETAALEATGDEAQMFIRAGNAHVGIGADRFAAGRLLEQQLQPDIFLLDDGFQHFRLHRRQDIVLIDAADPLAGGIFPLGRLREPLSALARATAIVVTRVEPGQQITGIERMVRRYNAKAPVLVSRIVPRYWFELEKSEVSNGVKPDLNGRSLHEPGFRQVVAFCGLGSPRAFWRTLEQLPIEVLHRATFRDHHRYGLDDLKKLAGLAAASGAGALVTTEKDAMNLPEDAPGILAPHRVFWLKIGIEIEREEELLRMIL